MVLSSNYIAGEPNFVKFRWCIRSSVNKRKQDSKHPGQSEEDRSVKVKRSLHRIRNVEHLVEARRADKDVSNNNMNIMTVASV